jgi:dihydrodipicolinate synthase/N-acetylneuraminate lyase
VFTGVGVALLTLFDEAGELDAAATAAHAQRVVELGMRAVVVAGSTGEAVRLLETLESFDGATYVGAAPLLALAGPLGAAGAILALGNLDPERCVLAFDGDADAQRGLLDGHRAASRSFPHGLKEAVAARFGTPTFARMG